MISHCFELCCSLLPLAAPRIPEMLSCQHREQKAPARPGDRAVGDLCPLQAHWTNWPLAINKENFTTFSWQCWEAV